LIASAKAGKENPEPDPNDSKRLTKTAIIAEVFVAKTANPTIKKRTPTMILMKYSFMVYRMMI